MVQTVVKQRRKNTARAVAIGDTSIEAEHRKMLLLLNKEMAEKLPALESKRADLEEELERVYGDGENGAAGMVGSLLRELAAVEEQAERVARKRDRYFEATLPIIEEYFSRREGTSGEQGNGAGAGAGTGTGAVTNAADLAAVSAKKSDRSGTLRRYFLSIDPVLYSNYYRDKLFVPLCSTCRIETLFNHTEGLHICPQCGKFEQSFINPNKYAHFEFQQQENIGGRYKYLKNFKVKLDQFLGISTVELTDVMRAKIEAAYQANPGPKDRIFMCNVLKRAGLNKYYKFASSLSFAAWGTQLPKFTGEEYDAITELFKEIDVNYVRFKSPTRSSFVSYGYVMGKLFEIMGRADLQRLILPIRSLRNLQEYDEFWKRVSHGRWKFYPSI